jgi:hypothetical protein
MTATLATKLTCPDCGDTLTSDYFVTVYQNGEPVQVCDGCSHDYLECDHCHRLVHKTCYHVEYRGPMYEDRTLCEDCKAKVTYHVEADADRKFELMRLEGRRSL